MAHKHPTRYGVDVKRHLARTIPLIALGMSVACHGIEPLGAPASEHTMLDAFFEGLDQPGHDAADVAGELERARRRVERLLEQQPCDLVTLEYSGALATLACTHQGRLPLSDACPDALEHLEHLRACSTRTEGALGAPGERLFAAGQVDAAVAWYRMLLTKHTQRSHWVLAAITALADAERHEAVLTMVDELPNGLLQQADVTSHRICYQAGLSAQASGQDQLAEQWFQRTASLLNQGRGLDEAVMAACPYQALGTLYREQGRHHESLDMFLLSAQREPDHAYAQQLVAQRAFELGRLELALEYVERALALQRDPGSLALRRNIESILLGELEEDGSLDREQALARALEAFDAYAFARADAIARLALEQVESPRLGILRAFAALMRGEHDDCASRLEALEDHAAAFPSLTIAEAHLAIARGDRAGAQAALGQAARLIDGDSAPAGFASPPPGWQATVRRLGWLARGWQAANQAEHERALQAFHAVLTTHPDDRFALLGRGNSANALGRLDQAQAAFERVLELDPNNQYALAELGLVAFNRGEDRAAERLFLEALEADPLSYTCPHEGLGMIYLRQRDFDQAERHFERAIEIDPDIEFRKYNGLARIYIRDGRLDEARALLDKSIANHPFDPTATQLLEELEALPNAGH